MKATARAPSNVALVKYWGKRDLALNLPATGSISVTLAGLETTASVETDPTANADTCLVDGERDERSEVRVFRFLDLVRRTFGVREHCHVRTRSNFPMGAGLASSASAFAALTVACDAAFDLGLSPEELSVLARRGSGSAARSLVDGYAEMVRGVRDDGSDAYAVSLGGPALLDLAVLAVVTTRARKTVGSTEGMQRTTETSPFHDAWQRRTDEDLGAMREALLASDLASVGRLAEENCLRMHAVMLAASPPLVYWNGVTVDVMQRVHALRDAGTPAWFTIDAGPQVKVLTAPEAAVTVESEIASIPGVVTILRSGPGQGARLVEDALA